MISIKHILPISTLEIENVSSSSQSVNFKYRVSCNLLLALVLGAFAKFTMSLASFSATAKVIKVVDGLESSICCGYAIAPIWLVLAGESLTCDKSQVTGNPYFYHTVTSLSWYSDNNFSILSMFHLDFCCSNFFQQPAEFSVTVAGSVL